MQEGASYLGELHDKINSLKDQRNSSDISDKHVLCSTSPLNAAGNEIIGIDLGTTNSCVAVLEGKVSVYSLTSPHNLSCTRISTYDLFCLAFVLESKYISSARL